MNITEAAIEALKKVVLPELAIIGREQAALKSSLDHTHQRLSDLNAPLVDQSRPIDGVHTDLTNRIELVRSALTTNINTLRSELTARVEHVRSDLTSRNDATNHAIARLYEVIVRRAEHQDLALRLRHLEQEVAELKKRLAA